MTREPVPLLLTWLLVLLVPGGLLAEPRPPAVPLTRDIAVKMIKAVLQAHQVADSPALNDKDLGGLQVDGQRVYFEYLPAQRALKVSALVYRFRQPPKKGVLEGLKKEEQSGTDTGGGTVDFQSDSRSLFLSRTYTQRVPDPQFAQDTERLIRAGLTWASEVMPRSAQKVFHPDQR